MGGKLPVPDDWNEEAGGWNILVACVPDSQKWRAIIEGNFYDLTFWNKWDPATGSINDAKRIANEIYESIQMACLADLTRIADNLERLNGILAGEKSAENDENGDPIWDYRESGIAPTMREIGIAPVEWTDDLGSIFTGEIPLASLLKTGLIGRRLDITPTPWEGDGLADIMDDQLGTANVNLDELHHRFRQFDISLDGTPFEKNITETLETLLRKTGVFDPEFQPNVADILDDSFNIRGDVIWTGWGKNLVQWLVNRSGLLPSHKQKVMEWFESKETISAIDILMLIAQTLDDLETQTAKIDASTQVTINTLQNCAPGPGINGTGETSVITITDEGAQITGPEPPPLLEN